MTHLLQLNTSLFAGDGKSSRLAGEFADAWRRTHPGGTVTVRDLSRESVPHLTAERFQAFLAPAASRTPAQAEIAAYSDALIAEVAAADLLVIGLPMYNFGLPSMLQAWFDHLARAGVTFRYTAEGPVGAFRGKRAIVFATRGGLHAGKASDSQTAQVRHFLGLIGIDEVEFVYAEGMGMGDAVAGPQLAAARDRIGTLTAQAANDAEVAAA